MWFARAQFYKYENRQILSGPAKTGPARQIPTRMSMNYRMAGKFGGNLIWRISLQFPSWWFFFVIATRLPDPTHQMTSWTNISGPLTNLPIGQIKFLAKFSSRTVLLVMLLARKIESITTTRDQILGFVRT